MKQLIQSYKTGELDLFEVPSPRCQDNGILVQTQSSLVSAGTEKMIVDIAKKSLLGKARSRPDLVRQVVDKMKREGVGNTLEKVFTKLDTPIPLGYSIAGKVLEVGAFGGDVSLGDRVACGGAGFANHAEVNYVPKNLYVKIPEGVSDQEASFVTVGAIALQGVRQAQVQLGEKVAVLGLGLIGQLTVQLLKASGCQVLGSDIDPKKIELAKKLGANLSCHAKDLARASQELSDGLGVDKVIITASAKGNGLVADAGHIARQKGKVVVVGLVGMDIPRDLYYKKELDFCLSMAYGPGRHDPEYELMGIDYPYAYVRWTEQRNFEAFLQMVAEKRVTPMDLVTHQFDFDETLKAYDLMTGKVQEDYLGIVLNYKSEALKTGEAIQINSQKMDSDKIRVGMIGAGNFTKAVILPQLKKNPRYALNVLATSTGMSAHASGRKFGFQNITTDEQSVLEHSEVDAVFITTPHNFHGPSALKALSCHKNVFVEKPLCLKMEELEKLDDFFKASEKSPVLQVGFNRRFAPLVTQMKELLGSNFPVSINYRVNAGMIPTDHWIQDPNIGGGRIMGEVCHFVDTCSYLCDSLVKSVYLQSVKSADKAIPVQDNSTLVLEFMNGSMATISYYAYGHSSLPKERIEVFAPEKAFVLDDFRKLHSYQSSGQKTWRSSNQDKGFKNEFDAFAESLIKGEPAISWKSLYNTTKTCLQANESLRTKRPVTIEMS
jgi:predicted dehydrogenase